MNTVPGLYLTLIHGRASPDEHLNDWGFAGPSIGPIESFNVTYNTTFRVFFSDEAVCQKWKEELGWDEWDFNCLEMPFVDDLVHVPTGTHFGYFGDWYIENKHE